MESKLAMNPVADKYGLMVAYLNGTEGRIRAMKDKRTWNAGGCCGIAQRENIDDVRYIDGFIKHMVETRNADPSRIYLLGHSNGAMMSYRFACQDPGIVSAIVTISGPLMVNNCPSATGLRVLHIQGEEDAHVPVAGGRGERTMTEDTVFRSVEETKKIMTAAGAGMTVDLIPGVDHNLGNIGRAINLPEKAARFLLNK
jgi:polyhydroxybutyrate depolymerase